MPVAAAVTLLTKLQSDIRYAEGEVLSNLLSSVDMRDYRVNQITAQVIPESQIVMRGSQYKGQYRLIGCRLDETSDRLCERQGIAL